MYDAALIYGFIACLIGCFLLAIAAALDTKYEYDRNDERDSDDYQPRHSAYGYSHRNRPTVPVR